MFQAIRATAFAEAHQMSGDLKITSDMSNPAPRAVMEGLVAGFQEMHPDMNIELTIVDREAWKTQIRNALGANPPDVVNWYAANRMGPYVDAGLFEDISDMWAGDMGKELASTKGAMTIDGKQYGVPYTYYQWGVYYRKDIYDKLSLTEPKTWDELLAYCDKMTAAGVTPFTIGTKFLWTAAGVFDYLNLRTNGYDVHNELTAGKIKYTDPRIRATFANWKTMLDRCPVVKNHATMSWQDAIAPFAKGDAAMYVMGNFSVGGYKDAGLKDEQIDFFQFPEITAGMARAEEAPADAFFIPAKAKNVENAKKFLSFIATPEVQGTWNKSIGQLPPNAAAPVNTDDKFIKEGMETVSTAAGLAQFFDRDAPAAMAKAGMEGFQKFMLDPSTLDEVLANLDKVQAEVYK